VIFAGGIELWDAARGGDFTGGVLGGKFTEAIEDDVGDESEDREDPDEDQFFLVGIEKGLKG